MRQLWRSPSLRTGLVYGAAGVGFAGANLLLARVLSTEEYALFTLVLALVNLGSSLAPAGIDGVVNRRHLEAGPALLRQVTVAALGISLAVAAVGRAGYALSPGMTGLLFAACLAGGVMAVASATFQSERRFGISLAIGQSPNLVLLAAAVVTVVARGREAWLPVLISAAGFVVAAAYGWAVLLRERHRKPHRDTRILWLEAFSFAGLNASGLLLLQLERLVIPQVLPVADLALFGVLAAIAGSLYRVLQMGVGYTLLPRLRAADGVLGRRRLIAHEARLVGGVALAGSLAIWFFTPLVERVVVGGRYHLGGALILAAIVSGVTKIANAFTKAVASALAEPRELSLVNMLGWISAGLAVVAADAGARWGLAGVIYGVAIGWALRAVAAAVPVWRHLRLPATVPATAP